DRPGPDNCDSPRQLGQREDSLVRKVARLRKSGYRKRGRASAGCDRRSLEAEFFPVDLDAIGCDKTSLADKHVDAETAKSFSGINRAQIGAQLAHPLHHGGKIDLRADW